MNKKNNNKISHQRYSTLFLCVLGVFAIAFIAYLSYAHKTSVKSQQLIIESYAKHIEKADSLYFDIAKYNKNVLIANQNINNTISVDSLIKGTLKTAHSLSTSEKKNLEHTINSYFNEIEALHKQYGEKLSKDSLRLSTERELLKGQTKAMLELHLDKIEHEYSNITIWGAVLTILFLVFSFYSIFKMDELIKQGKEGVDEIKELKKEGKRIEKQYKNAVKTTKLNLTAKSGNILNNFEKQLTETTEKYRDLSKSRQQEFDKIVTQANSILKQLRDNLDLKEGEQQNG